ncbi:MAG: hypothetical protein PQJ46_11615, partial [Spirochaetales bacterium]|nr:hypothetical protein [Spirochaetales bacterium]
MKKLLTVLLLTLTFSVMIFANGQTEEGGSDDGSELKPLNILFSSTNSETETGGQIIAHFAEHLKEISGGKINVTVKYGGTLYQSADELQAVSSGAVQMIALGHNPHSDMVPRLCSFPDFAPDNSQNALNYFKHILFENEASAAALE